MSGNENLIDYSMYDQATDGFFTIRVSASKATELNYDKSKTSRIIQSLKAQGQVPEKRGVPFRGTGAVPKLRWSLAATRELLRICSQHRLLLRQKKVPLEVYQSVASQMNVSGEHDSVTATQCREKMRALKKAKEENSHGDGWEFAKSLRFIFDSPLDQDESPRHELGLTYTENHPKFVTSSSAYPDVHLQSSNTHAAAAYPDVHLQSSHCETLLRPPLGITYTVINPKVTTCEQAEANTDFPCFPIDPTPSETLLRPPLGITYTVINPKVTTCEQAEANTDFPSFPIDPTSSNELPIHDVLEASEFDSDHILDAAEGPNFTEQLHNSSFLPSETLFVKNLNANSTPTDTASVCTSPAKKKTTHGEAGKRTPRSTPRRKKRYQTEAWMPGITHAFLKECILHKEYLQMGNPPTRIWKEISENLLKSGFSSCDWQSCREKYENLSAFFERSMTKANGFMGQTKWPYYDAFLEIHDLPKGYIFQPNHDDDEEEEPDHPDTAIQLLISLYKEKKHLFKSKSTIRHSTLYQEIASTMNNFDYRMTSKQCQNKMNALLGKFRKEYLRLRNTGESPSTWEWYGILLEMEEGSPNLEAPFVFSTGANTHYSSQGLEKPVVEKRNTRTRGPNLTAEAEDDPDPKPTMGTGKKPPKKQLYRNWQQDIEEKKAKAKEDIVEEFRRIRVAQEANNDSKTKALQTMAQAMSDLTAYLNQSKGNQ